MTCAEPSPFLLGGFAPVDRERTIVDLPVRGHLPAALDGLFTTIGPNPVKPPRRTGAREYQWFRQDGMVSGIRMRDGQARWFRNRWIRSTRVTSALGETRAPGPRHFPVDTVHTNVVGHAGLLLALVETGCSPVQLTASLDTAGYTDLDGALTRGISAHPKVDPATGELHTVVCSPLRRTAEYVVLDSTGALRQRRPLHLGGRPLLHDIALTTSYVVLFDLPVRFRPIDAVAGRMPYRWDDRHRSRIGVLPRILDGQIRWFDIPPCFLFHTVTAQERGNMLDIRAVRYPRLFDTGSADPFGGEVGNLWQWTVDLGGGQVGQRQLDDRPQELPRVNPSWLAAGAQICYSVTADQDRDGRHRPEALLQHDIRTGNTRVRTAPEHTVQGEAVFVPDPSADASDRDCEDHGWLLHLRYDERSDTSALVVVDARDFTGPPLAVLDLPVRVPFGFHCSWIPGPELPPQKGTAPA